MKRISIALAAAALLLAGCASANEEADGTSTVSASGTEERSVQAEEPAPTTTDDGFIDKRVNEDAGATCSAEAFEDCDVTFRVTDLQRGFECSVPSSLLSGPAVPDGYEPLLVRVEAEMGDSFADEHSDNVLHSQHWGAIDKDGYYIQSPDMMYCPDLDSDLNRLYPGTKARGALLLAVPEETETLRLGMLADNGGWEWKIPN